MPVLIPSTLDAALDMLAEHPDADLLAGGTDSMVEVNEARARPSDVVLALSQVVELRSWRHDPATGVVRIGAGVTWTQLIDDPLRSFVPALADAARTVGSPQIRNAGTLGGNLATCSPAGDGLPVLSALGASVDVVSPTGRRTLPVDDFMVGVKRTALEPGELIAAVAVPVVGGWQGYAKVGVRNAMVISVAGVCVVLDRDQRSVAIALGSVGPTVIRAVEAESRVAADIEWETLRIPVTALSDARALVMAAAQPITDHRSTEAYRRHAVGVLARRLLARAEKEPT